MKITRYTKKEILKILLFLNFLLLFHALQSQTWNQVGNNIDGEAANDFSGLSVCMPDTQTVAIGTPNNDGNGADAGHVRIYELNSGNWIQKGLDIDGEAEGDYSGESISMPDNKTIAIGAPFNDGNGAYSGHVRVFEWDGSNWIQKGQDIDGEAGFSLGKSVSMPDTNTLVIGMVGDNNIKGLVRIYQWDGNNWIQKGQEIEGEASEDRSWIVSMPDTNTVAIGAPTGDANGVDSGYVRIFEWDGNNWVQKGQTIAGEAENNFSGSSISMPDANTIAIGAPANDNAGHVRIYEWNGSNWIQKGLDIDGEGPGDYSGGSVSMPDANTVAIGAEGYYSTQNQYGQVRVFEWNGSNWIQKGQDIDGEQILSIFGSSVSMPDANTVAAGSPYFDSDNGEASGNTRVFSFQNLGVNDSNFGNQITLYPNPACQEATIHLGTTYENISLRVTNIVGQTIVQKQHTNIDSISLKLNQEEGIYFVTVTNKSKQKTLKLIVCSN